MSVQNNTLSPSLFAALLDLAADGRVKAAHLVSQVQAGQPVSYHHHSAMFTKDRPGAFEVVFYRDGTEQGRSIAATPVEAKLEVLEFLITQAREAKKGN